jgi:hypothetical protein
MKDWEGIKENTGEANTTKPYVTDEESPSEFSKGAALELHIF